MTFFSRLGGVGPNAAARPQAVSLPRADRPRTENVRPTPPSDSVPPTEYPKAASPTVAAVEAPSTVGKQPPVRMVL